MNLDKNDNLPSSSNRENLYASRVPEASGFIRTDQDSLEASFWGEILLYGHFEDDLFMLEQVRRIALYSSLNDPTLDSQIGILSLVGPLTDVDIVLDEESIQNPPYRWRINNVHMRLHYAALTQELPPFREGKDGVVPQVEEIVGHIILAQDPESTEKKVLYHVEEFILPELVEEEQKLAIVKEISLDPRILEFGTMRTEPYEEDSKANSLPPNCGLSSELTCSTTSMETFQRVLPIKFISFSLNYTLDEVDTICQKLIQKVCQVWGQKGALDLTIKTTIEEGTGDQRTAYSVCSTTDEAQLPAPPPPPTGPGGPSYNSATHLEVYLVDDFNPDDHGGGITHDIAMGSAYCILKLSVAETNEYLLAHELCHVLGLAHSDGTQGIIPGSAGSIADPDAPPGPPIPKGNTRYNCRIFDPPFDSTVLNPLVLHKEDAAGNWIPDCFHPETITDVTLLLDYSGSMLQADAAGHSKWDSAKMAANMFNAIYSALNVHGLDNRIGLVLFHAEGSNGPNHTAMTSPLAAPTMAPLVSEPDPDIDNWTPMGTAVVTGYQTAPPPDPEWRDRVMILLTDGKENREPLLSTVRSATSGAANYVPSVMENAKTGYRIHTCAFGPPGEIDTDAIESLALGSDGLKYYDGDFHSTESSANPDEAFALKVHFLSLIAATTPAEIIGPFNSTFPIGPGINELVCLVTGNVSFTVNPPPTHTDPISPTNATQPGFSFVHIHNPAPGSWSLSGFNATPTLRGFAMVDLTLSAHFYAGRTGIGVGRPIPLWAEIKENGVDVSGAIVTVEMEGPGESMGQLLTNYTRHQSFNPAQWKHQLKHILKVEPLSLQRQLLLAAFEQRGFDLRRIENQITLTETAPGRYEGAWLDTLEEGTYTFHFKATGKTHDDYNFQRNYSLSRHLAPVPAPELTTIFWSSPPLIGQKSVLWQATIMPRTASGRPLGPGLADKLSIQLTKNGNDILPVVDNLDGSYAIELTLPPRQIPPPLTLRFGNRREPLSFSPTPTPSRRVRLNLKRIKVLDDKETWFPSPGELVFNSVVAPNGDANRAIYRRIPAKGHISLRDGESKNLDFVLFDGYVEEGAALELVMGGTERDDLLLFTKKDALIRYQRRFSDDKILSWAGMYSPDDEPDDPEALRDWQVWYEIEVL